MTLYLLMKIVRTYPRDCCALPAWRETLGGAITTNIQAQGSDGDLTYDAVGCKRLRRGLMKPARGHRILASQILVNLKNSVSLSARCNL